MNVRHQGYESGKRGYSRSKNPYWGYPRSKCAEWDSGYSEGVNQRAMDLIRVVGAYAYRGTPDELCKECGLIVEQMDG